MSKVDEIIKYVTSSDIEKLEQLRTGDFPIVDQFPLGGKWRKQVTLMHLAAAYGSLTCIQYLLGKVDVNAQTDDGVCYSLTGLLFFLQPRTDTKAVLSSCLKMVQMQLLSTENALHLAAMNGNPDIVIALLDAGVDPNATTNIGWNGVHYAAKESMSAVLDPLVVHDVDIDHKSNIGEAPLHIAAKYGADEFATALLNFGADVNIQDKTGGTPLHTAISCSNFSVAKVLLQNGADTQIRNNGGQTPADTAPLKMTNQTRAFFQNWEDWDELVDAIQFHGQDVP